MTNTPIFSSLVALTLNLRTALLFVAALLMVALVTFLRRRPSFPIALEYTDEEKESYRKAIEASFGKAVPFPGLFHEMTSMDFLVIPPNESCPFFILCTMGLGTYRMKVPEKWLVKEAKKIPEMKSLRFPGHDRAELMMLSPRRPDEAGPRETE